MSESVREFLDALTEYQVSRFKHDKARDACQYDWGYFGQDEIDRLKSAEGRFEEAIRQLVLSIKGTKGE